MDDDYSYLLILCAMAAIAIVVYLIYRYKKSCRENVTEEGIMTMVHEGHEPGVLKGSEAEMITNIFEFTALEAGDIMTHRKNIVALDGAMLLKDAARFVLKEGKNSRYPVYGKDMDDIIGTVHMRDVLIRVGDAKESGMELRTVPEMMREARFIPETRNINSLFKEMQSRKMHMAIVVDEYGQTTGLVTMEDILEEIVGNILDEYDVDEEYIVRLDDDSLLMDGLTPLKEAAEVMGIEFPAEDLNNYDTLNGLLISRLDRIPGAEEEPDIVYMGYLFSVIKIENKMIQSVRVVKLPEEAFSAKEEPASEAAVAEV